MQSVEGMPLLVLGHGVEDTVRHSLCSYKRGCVCSASIGKRPKQQAICTFLCTISGMQRMLIMLLQLKVIVWLDSPIAEGSSSDQHQAKALEAGGFAAISLVLQPEELSAATAAGQMVRELLLQGLCLAGLAFAFSPMALPGALLSDILELLGALLQGNQALVAAVWEETQVVTRPVRYMLEECSQLFPAFMWPLLQLLRPLCQGAYGAEQAYKQLQKVQLSVVHKAEDLARLWVAGDRVEMDGNRPWSMAPEVEGSVIPEVGGKVVLANGTLRWL